MDRIIVFSSPYFLLFSLLPACCDQRSRSRSSLADCRSLARHVSADFPIKPAQRVSIDANQRLLSACPPILHLFTIALDRATCRLSLRREKLNARAFHDLVSLLFFLLSPSLSLLISFDVISRSIDDWVKLS